MRRAVSVHRSSEPVELKMTPMIDVIFLLLIFFVATAGKVEEILPTNLLLPGSQSEHVIIDPDIKDLGDVRVRIGWSSGNATWQVQNQAYGSLKDVGGKLRAIASKEPDLPVILIIDGAVPMDDVIDAYDECREAGLTKIRFAASSSANAS